MASGWSHAEGVRLLVALGTLGIVFSLLLATLLVGGDHAALVTGLLSALSGVTGWYFGSDGVASANQRAALSDAERLDVLRRAEVATAELERLRRQIEALSHDLEAGHTSPPGEARVKDGLESEKSR